MSRLPVMSTFSAWVALNDLLIKISMLSFVTRSAWEVRRSSPPHTEQQWRTCSFASSSNTRVSDYSPPHVLVSLMLHRPSVCLAVSTAEMPKKAAHP